MCACVWPNCPWTKGVHTCVRVRWRSFWSHPPPSFHDLCRFSDFIGAVFKILSQHFSDTSSSFSNWLSYLSLCLCLDSLCWPNHSCSDNVPTFQQQSGFHPQSVFILCNDLLSVFDRVHSRIDWLPIERRCPPSSSIYLWGFFLSVLPFHPFLAYLISMWMSFIPWCKHTRKLIKDSEHREMPTFSKLILSIDIFSFKSDVLVVFVRRLAYPQKYRFRTQAGHCLDSRIL